MFSRAETASVQIFSTLQELTGAYDTDLHSANRNANKLDRVSAVSLELAGSHGRWCRSQVRGICPTPLILRRSQKPYNYSRRTAPV